MYTHFESLLLASAMPRADVLLSHDTAFFKEQYNHAHAGLVGVTYYLLTHAVGHHIHGHLHRSYRATHPNGTVEHCVYGLEYLTI